MIAGLIWLNHDLLMTTFAIILVVLSAAMHAGRNFLTKKAGDKQAFVWWYEIVGLLLFTPLFGAYVDPTALGSANCWLLITISGLLHFAYWVFLTKALENGDLSLVYPITRSSPALVLIVSMFVLSEEVSLRGAAGILLVATGSYCINMHELRFSALVRPMLSLSTDRAIQFALLTLLSVSAYSIVDKVAVAKIHPVVFAYLYPWISMLLFSHYLGVRKNWQRIKDEWQSNHNAILICGGLSIFGYFLILVAFTVDRVSYIVGLRQLSIVFAVLLGGFALNEKHRAIRLAFALVVFAGTFLIVTG